MINRKPRQFSVREQIIEDPVSGLTIQFLVMDNGMPKLIVFGDLPYGNREFVFDEDGMEAGAGTVLTCPRRPNWIRKIEF